MRIGVLKYNCLGKREGNHGETVFVNSLNYDVIPVTWLNWRTVDVLLISIPSTFHYQSLLEGMYKYGFEHRGKTKVIVGGFAAINPFLLWGYFDFWVWGRVRNVSNEVIEACLSGKTLDFAAYPEELQTGVKKIIRQEGLYDNEDFCGCPYKCKFCQYAHIRKYEKIGKSGYVQGSLTGGNSPEVMFKDILKITEKPGRLRAGLDGSSENIRFKYGKKISNKMIIDTVQHLGTLAQGNTSTVLKLYTINNFPGETQEDKDDLVKLFSNMPDTKGRIIIVLVGMGFRPMPLTPLQYEPAGIFPSLLPLRQKVLRDDNLRVTWAYSLEGPLYTLRNVITERCSLETLNQCRSVLMRNVAADSDRVARSMIKSFNLERIIGKQESLPTDFLSTAEKPRD